MISQQTFPGNWNEVKGKLLRRWGSLTDDDLAIFNGSVDQLVGAIQRKTGDARENIEQFVEQLDSNGAVASVREGYAEVEAKVRQKPAKTVAVCFGAGVVTGVVATLVIRRRLCAGAGTPASVGRNG
jgi:uncharacterized protein YjbJ (UPF0337 family)